jgi:hypothetical protein
MKEQVESTSSGSFFDALPPHFSLPCTKDELMSYSRMVVIFLDILGSKKNIGFSNKHEVHTLFHGEAKLNESRQKNISHVIYERKIFSFSDCAYILYKYKDGVDETRKNDANLIFIAAFNTNLSIMRFLSRGYFVRGGISFGEAYFDEMGCFGPAVDEAYELESQYAKYPRVIFSAEAGKMVFDWEHNMEDKDPGLMSLYREMPFLTEKEEDIYFSNIFYDLQKNGSLNLEGNTLTLDRVKEVALEKIQADIDRNKDNGRIVEKLEWMEKFVKSKKFLLDETKAVTIFNVVSPIKMER